MYKIFRRCLINMIKILTDYLYRGLSNFVWSFVSFFWLSVWLESNGKTETGAAGTVSHRAFKKVNSLITISFLNLSSCVKRSSMRKERTYLKGTVSRIVEPNKSTMATSVVIWERKKRNKSLNNSWFYKQLFEEDYAILNHWNKLNQILQNLVGGRGVNEMSCLGSAR